MIHNIKLNRSTKKHFFTQFMKLKIQASAFKLFIILTKYISLERSDSQDSIFGGS